MRMIELNLSPDRRQLKQFGWIACGAFGLLAALNTVWGGLLGFDFGSATRTVSMVLVGVGLTSALLSSVAPQANRLLYVTLLLISFPIGTVVSYVIMGTLFYGLITPVGLLRRLMGRDSLERDRDPAAGSYWVEAKRQRTRESYLRQF